MVEDNFHRVPPTSIKNRIHRLKNSFKKSCLLDNNMNILTTIDKYRDIKTKYIIDLKRM